MLLLHFLSSLRRGKKQGDEVVWEWRGLRVRPRIV